MEKVRLAPPDRGIRTHIGRQFVFVLVATLTLGLAAPAQAGLGDLIDGVLDPITEIPVVGGIVDPVVDEIVVPVLDPIVEDVVAPVVEDLVAPSVQPVVEEVVPPVLDEALPPVVDEVAPPLDPIRPPVTDDVAVPHVESVKVPVTSVSAEPPTIRTITSFNDAPLAIQTLPGRSNQIFTEVHDQGSLVLAQSLQTALARATLASPIVAGSLVDSSHARWLNGLTDWLGGATNGLMDLLSIPLRLLELLARALLTAGSGLVAPASLALAFTIYAVRDRRWQGFGKTAHN